MADFDYARPINVVAPELFALATLPVVYFASAAVSVTEGNSGQTNLTLIARRSTLTGALVVPAAFVPGSAVASDFPGGLPGNKVFAFIDGSDTATVVIPVNGDTDYEGNDTFGYQLQPGAGYRLGTPFVVTGTILNDDSDATPAIFTMAQLATPNRVYQRDVIAVDGQPHGAAQMVGSIPVLLTVTKAGTIYARTRAVTAGNPILSPSRKVLDNVATGTRAVAITGIPAIVDEFYLDLSPDGVTWTLGTVPVGMGRLVFLTGQSLQVRNFQKVADATTIAEAGVTVTTRGAVYGSGETETGGQWRPPSDGGPVTSAGAAELINLQSALFNVRIGLVFCAVGNTSLEAWQPGTANSDSAVATLNAIGNRIEAHWHYQGHSDVGRSYREYWSLLKTWMGTVAANTVGSAPARYFTAIPNINSNGFGPEAFRAMPRSVAEDYAKAIGATYLPMNDIAMVAGEGIHAVQAGAVRQVQHFHRATRVELGLAGDKGGTYGAPIVSGSTVTVPVTLPAGATGLVVVGDPKKRFAIRDRGKGDPLTISDLTIGAAVNGVVNLVFTMAAPLPSSRVEVSPFLTSGDDGRVDMIYANLNEGEGTNPVGRQLWTPARPVLSRPKVALDVSGVTFAAGAYGQGRAGGDIRIRQGTMPSVFGGMSIEMMVTPTSLAGGVQVIAAVPTAGYFKQDGATMGWGDGDTVPIELGKSYHVVLYVEPGGRYKGALVNGISVNAGSIDNPSLDSEIWIGHLNGGFGYTRGVIDELAMFYAPWKYPVVGYAPPTSPYVGNEDGLLHLWHLNGDGADSCSLNA